MLGNDGSEVFDSEGCGSYIHKGYTIFGKFVNRYRHIPGVVDGLKPVYRHVIQASYENPDKLTKTVAVVGDALKKYHYSGDASVTPVVSELVNTGMLIGQGNHGNYVLRGPNDPPAAMRYTESKMNPIIREQLGKILPYVPHKTSVTGYEEYAYIPTPIPLTLIFGSLGIGLGIGCRIPAFTIESLYDAYLNDDYTRLKLNYDYELDPDSMDGLKDLWEEGYGSLRLNIPITDTWISGTHGFVVSCTPKVFKPNLTQLEEWEQYGWISIDDISDDKPKLFIYRTKRTRSITDDDILDALKVACTKKMGYKCVVYDGNITGKIGIKNWIKVAFDNYTKLYDQYRNDQILKLEFDWILWRDFHRVAELILEQNPDNSPKYSYEDIVDLVNKENCYKKDQAFISSYKELTLDHVNAIGRKSINTLRTAEGSDKLSAIEAQIDAFKNLDIDNEIKNYVESWKSL